MIKINYIFFIVVLVVSVQITNCSFHECIEKGNLQEVKALISSGVNINKRDHFGRTPLHWAAIFGQFAIAQELVRGPEVILNKREKSTNQTALSLAASHGHDNIADLLLSLKGIDINAGRPLLKALSNRYLDIALRIIHHPEIWIDDCDIDGLSALALAIQYGNQEVIKAIVNHPKFDINKQSENGQTQLHKAIEADNLGLLMVLLSIPRINLNLWTMYGDTPLHRAASKGQFSAVQALIAHGADPNACNLQGETPLHRAIEEKHSEIAELLIKTHGIHLNIQNRYGDSPLHRAVSLGQRDVVQQLLIFRANKNLRNCDLDTPLHRAIVTNHDGIALDLIRNGDINVELANKSGDTPLHTAIYAGKEELVLELLKAGAPVNWKNAVGKTPLHIAVQSMREKIIEYLLAVPGIDINAQANTGSTSLYYASKLEATLVVQALLNKGALVNVCNNACNSPLHAAIENDHHNAYQVAMLLLKSANIDVNVCNKNGDTPLHRATYLGRLGLLDTLLLAKANVNARNCCLKIPLHEAVASANCCCRAELTSRLLKNVDIDINAQDNKGNTPLHCVQNLSVLEELLKFPVIKVNMQNNEGNTPLHELIIHYNVSWVLDYINLLLARGADCTIKNHNNETPLNLTRNISVWHKHSKIMADVIQLLQKKESSQQLGAFLLALHPRCGSKSAARFLTTYICRDLHHLLFKLMKDDYHIINPGNWELS